MKFPQILLAQVDKARLGKRTQADLELEQLFFRPNLLRLSALLVQMIWNGEKNCGVAREVFDGKELQVFLEDVPWGKIARDGTGVLVPFDWNWLGENIVFEQTQQLIETAFPIGRARDSQFVCGQRKVG